MNYESANVCLNVSMWKSLEKQPTHILNVTAQAERLCNYLVTLALYESAYVMRRLSCRFHDKGC